MVEERREGRGERIYKRVKRGCEVRGMLKLIELF